jgi:protein-serine/threonine kinase
LLEKRETARLGSRSGASEVKQHKWFAKTNWGLLRNMQPPVSFSVWARVARTPCPMRCVPSLLTPFSQIIPASSNGVDAVNFRHMHESTSLQIEQGEIVAVAGSGLASVPPTPGLDDGMDPMDAALFESFSNVTLHHDGES